MRVMLHMLGSAGDDETRWHQWSADRARLLEMIATRAERKTAHITGESMTGYFCERLAERARGDTDDAISLLAREAARGELINTAEAADMLGVIMIAGNETTANLIGNGLWALMRHPDQMERLREEPERARDAINEVLRYDSPVQHRGTPGMRTWRLPAFPKPAGRHRGAIAGPRPCPQWTTPADSHTLASRPGERYEAA